MSEKGDIGVQFQWRLVFSLISLLFSSIFHYVLLVLNLGLVQSIAAGEEFSLVIRLMNFDLKSIPLARSIGDFFSRVFSRAFDRRDRKRFFFFPLHILDSP